MTPKQTKITFFKSIQELSTTMHSVFVPAPQSHLTRLAVFLASSTMLSPFTVHNANRRWSGRSKLLIACTWAGSEGAKFDQGVQDTADLQSRNSLRSAGKHEKASVLAESKRCDSSRHDATLLDKCCGWRPRHHEVFMHGKGANNTQLPNCAEGDICFSFYWFSRCHSAR